MFSELEQIRRSGCDSGYDFVKAGEDRYRPLAYTRDDDEHFHDLSEAEQTLVIRWLKWNVYPGRDVCKGHSSYGMKHILEDRTNIYMTNNQFKEAMLQCGFKPDDDSELNWLFYIRKSSPVFQTFGDGKTGIPMLGIPMRYRDNRAVPDDADAE